MGSVLAQDTFDAWKKKQTQEFMKFKDTRDKEFLKMLSDTWKTINSTKARDLYEKPKSVDIPVIERPAARHEPLIEDITIPGVPVDLDPARPVDIPELQAAIERYRKSTTDFYVVYISYSYPGELNIHLDPKINKQSIRAFWATLGSSNYGPMLDQTLNIKSQLALNDWGYILLLYCIGQDMYGAETNESVLFTWFMMTKAGYQAKVGYDQAGIYLLLPAANQLYNTRFFRIDGIKYYAPALTQKHRRQSQYPNSYARGQDFPIGVVNN